MRNTTLLLAILLAACAAPRRQLERAAAYEREGMASEAFNAYEQLHQRRPRSVEAHTGMRRSAQTLFGRIQQEASELYLANDLAGGERKRQEAATFKQRMDRKGLDLQWDPLLEPRRREAQLHEATRLYGQADAAFRAGRFAEAEELAAAVLKLDPGRKEAEYLLRLSRLEPLYLQGGHAMELGLWREAFLAFKRVTSADAGYKDAWALMEQARERARLVLAHVPLVNRSLYTGGMGATGQGALEAHLAASVKQAILGLNDPLLVLVDRDNTDRILAEQQRQLSGVFDDRYVVEAGKLMGARYVLTARILRYDEVLRREIEVQTQLLDAETGRIHLSEVMRVHKEEIARGNTRSQLMERAAKRIAGRLAEFDPGRR